MNNLATRLAAALFLKRGEISLSDIEALPFVEDEYEAANIARRLMEMFDTDMRRRRLGGSTRASDWEEVIVLRAPSLKSGHPELMRQRLGDTALAASRGRSAAAPPRNEPPQEG